MILNTGMRTDIPAFYSKWLMNRVREGFVMVRNPYDPGQITRYRLTPDVVDILLFCTKNPEPMLPYLDELKPFRLFWFVTITPYGREIEPNVPDLQHALRSFQKLSDAVGKTAVAWRYDPIFLTGKYDLATHIEVFSHMAETLREYTDQVVISFIDLYTKTRRNFPEARAVLPRKREAIGKAFFEIAAQNGMTVRSCMEGTDLAPFGVDVSGCMTKEVLERATGIRLTPPHTGTARPGCSCLLGNDIGAYNTCPHLCRYCYANYDARSVRENCRRHDPASPLLIGRPTAADRIHDAQQRSYISAQLSLDL